AIGAETAVNIDEGDMTGPDHVAPKNFAQRPIRPNRSPPAIEEAVWIDELPGADRGLQGHLAMRGSIGIENGVGRGAPLGTPVPRTNRLAQQFVPRIGWTRATVAAAGWSGRVRFSTRKLLLGSLFPSVPRRFHAKPLGLMAWISNTAV